MPFLLQQEEREQQEGPLEQVGALDPQEGCLGKHASQTMIASKQMRLTNHYLHRSGSIVVYSEYVQYRYDVASAHEDDRRPRQ